MKPSNKNSRFEFYIALILGLCGAVVITAAVANPDSCANRCYGEVFLGTTFIAMAVGFANSIYRRK